ncbi:MAG: hypothetical protein V2I54_01395 [Bacteroidales bacterium]|jgi:hypothetical protein|nr:hypothetical protein [Bacteroidales bacterium]
MSKNFKYLLWSVIIIAGIYIFYNAYIILKYKHSVDWTTHKNYVWLFKESERHKVDTNFAISCVRDKDVYNHYAFNNFEYKVIIWEFKDLANIKLDNIFFEENQIIDLSEIKSGETFHKHSDLEITVKYGFYLNDSILINLDRFSHIEKYISSENYIGFYGNVNQMSFCNETGESQIIFNYIECKSPTLLLNYKGNDSFYLIVINSDKEFDESIINILDLQ